MELTRSIDLKEYWPGGISDGLTLPCHFCGQHTNLNYIVTDDAWKKLITDPEASRGVVCIHCFADLCFEAGMRLSDVLIEIQLHCAGETVLLKPAMAFRLPD